MKFWTWILGHGMALVVAGIVAFLLLTKVQSCRDSADSESATVLKERIRADSIRAVGDSIALADARRQLDLALTNTGKGVDRWREVKVPVYLPPNATVHDTIQSLAKRLNACYAAGDSLLASVVPLKAACTAYRDTATRSIATLNLAIAHRDSLLDIRARGKRVQPYGAGLYDLVNRRPVFRVGTTTKEFWRLDGMAEAEYAIPSATKAESGDGLRLLAGLRINW